DPVWGSSPQPGPRESHASPTEAGRCPRLHPCKVCVKHFSNSLLFGTWLNPGFC
ncbi:unnamed protein product, partial [Gulo gulo]